MLHCEKCGVNVAGKREICPLCQGRLSGNPCQESFPLVPTIYLQFHLLFRILLFVSVAFSIIAVAVNLILEQTGWWSLIVVGGIASMWLSLSLAIRKRKNIPKTIVYQVILISLICIVWDFLTQWSGWSIDYVVPILFLSGIAAMAVLTKVLSWEIENIIIYLCIDALFGIVPIIFYFTRTLHVAIPSVLCVTGCVLSLAFLCIFKGDSIWAEFKRRMNF